MQITYKAGTTKENGKYYPIVKFWSDGINDSLIIKDPQDTRSQAITYAKNRIKQMKKLGK